MHRGVKLNNKGFTLIETIVAMSILVLVSIPLMDSISRGMRVGRDTSSFQRAVLLGQSVTEGVRAHSVTDLCSTFVMSDKYMFDILDSNVYKYEKYGRLELTPEGNSYKYMDSNVDTNVNSNSRKYYYGIAGVESGAKKYDVLIKVDSDKYNDINSKIIPSIVEVGSEGTVVIDNTGTLNNIGNKTLTEMAREKLGISSSDKMKCKMDIYITKHKAENIDDSADTSITRGAYHVYGNITYYTVSDPRDSYLAATKSYTFLNVGEDSFDINHRLNYMYVVCNGEGLEGTNDIIFHMDAKNLYEWDSKKVDIPVAIVTANCDISTNTKWKLSTADADTKEAARAYLTFLTNNGSESNIYTTEVTKIDNFGDSGKKIRRIYELTVQVYDYQSDIGNKFKTKALSDIKSALIR